jgi:hypothetical protein
MLRWFYAALLCAIFATKIYAQDQVTKKLVAEASHLRETTLAPDTNLSKAAKDERDRIAALNDALRDWVESRLPKSRASLDSGLAALQDRIRADLSHAGMLPPPNGAEEYGYVGGVEIFRPAEFPEALAITERITSPCGTADSLYAYDFSGGSPRRVLESRGSSDQDETLSGEYFSDRAPSGNRLFLALRHAAQCGSSWNRLSYELFRLTPDGSAAVSILSGDHGISTGAGDPYRVQLKPDELFLELRDRSIDTRIRNRTHVLHYSVTPSSVERIDPIALTPQDFVDEWLTRPWAEISRWSSVTEHDNLERWHGFLSGDSDTAEIRVVQPCTDKPDDWKVVLSMEWVAGNKLPEAFTLYFRVQRVGNSRFEMAAIGFHQPDGCPGDAPPAPASQPLFDTNTQSKDTQGNDTRN